MSLLERPGLFWRLQILGWGAFTGIYAAATMEVLPLDQALTDKGVFGGAGFLISLGLWRVCRLARGWPWPRAMLAVTVACYVGGLTWSTLYGWVLMVLGVSAAETWWPRLGGALGMSATLLAWCALYFGAVYSREIDLQAAELARERERSLVAQGQARDAQLRALRYQLDPHFLFNALNAVSTLVAEGQGEAAQDMISRLSDFLRATLDERDTPGISLARELEFVDHYLAIERARLQERLQVQIRASEDSLSATVPALLLQPLVENAVRHGIVGRPGGGRLELLASRTNGRLHLTVRDAALVKSSVASNKDAPRALGLGLSNTRARLAAFFHGDFALTLEAQTDATEIRIDLPYRAAPPADSPA